MKPKYRQPPEHNDGLSLLNTAIDALGLSRSTTGMEAARNAFDTVGSLLTTIRDSMINQADCVELGLACASVCESLNQGIKGNQVDQPGQSVLNAIEQLTGIVAEIRRQFIKRGKRNIITQRLREKEDEQAIAAWKIDLDRIYRIFDTELTVRDDASTPNVLSDTLPGIHSETSKGCADTGDENRPSYASVPEDPPPQTPRTMPGTGPSIHLGVMKIGAIVSEVQRDVVGMREDILKIREDHEDQNRETRNRPGNIEAQRVHRLTFGTGTPGESPPPPPRIFFGRDDLVEEVIDLAEQLTPIGLIGTGGIGKTSIALTVLHDPRMKQRFGDDRRFIRCDQFPPSLTHLLRRLSEVIGATIENPESLAPLRPFISSKEMMVIFDNAESILDPQGADAAEIYSVIEELSQLNNVCLCITSRISTIPPNCETLEIPTLSAEAARDTFYRIYRRGERSDSVNSILEQLEFHPLSITLLATVGNQNKWSIDRLIDEWERRRTGVLETKHKASLAATIELSLTSPTFQELGPDAPGILGVVAFYPQGVNENNLGWLFPTTSNAAEIFDSFCILSLTYRSDGFVTMLAPLRDYLSPKDPLSSPHLRATRVGYFTRLDGFAHGEGGWIVPEDVNVEYLLDVLTSIDKSSCGVWDACAKFFSHLYWHKPRRVTLGWKIEGLPDDHPSRPACLRWLSGLAQLVGDHFERVRLCSQLRGDTGDLSETVRIFVDLSQAQSAADLHEEAIQRAREALEICEWLRDSEERVWCLAELAGALEAANKLDAAEEIVSLANFFPEDCDQFFLSGWHCALGATHVFRGNAMRAIEHLEVALEIVLSDDVYQHVAVIVVILALVLCQQRRLEEADARIELAKPYAVRSNQTLFLARLMGIQASIQQQQHGVGEPMSRYARAGGSLEELGASLGAGIWRSVPIVLIAQGNNGTDNTSGAGVMLCDG